MGVAVASVFEAITDHLFNWATLDVIHETLSEFHLPFTLRDRSLKPRDAPGSAALYAPPHPSAFFDAAADFVRKHDWLILANPIRPGIESVGSPDHAVEETPLSRHNETLAMEVSSKLQDHVVLEDNSSFDPTQTSNETRTQLHSAEESSGGLSVGGSLETSFSAGISETNDKIVTAMHAEASAKPSLSLGDGSGKEGRELRPEGWNKRNLTSSQRLGADGIVGDGAIQTNNGESTSAASRPQESGDIESSADLVGSRERSTPPYDEAVGPVCRLTGPELRQWNGALETASTSSPIKPTNGSSFEMSAVSLVPEHDGTVVETSQETSASQLSGAFPNSESSNPDTLDKADAEATLMETFFAEDAGELSATHSWSAQSSNCPTTAEGDASIPMANMVEVVDADGAESCEFRREPPPVIPFQALGNHFAHNAESLVTGASQGQGELQTCDVATMNGCSDAAHDVNEKRPKPDEDIKNGTAVEFTINQTSHDELRKELSVGIDGFSEEAMLLPLKRHLDDENSEFIPNKWR